MNVSQRPSSTWLGAEKVAVAYLVLAIGALVVLRASVDDLEFLGAGWLIVLAVVPLAPLLLDRAADLAKALSPHVSSVKVGALQVDLRDARQAPINLNGTGALPAVPNDMFAFQATGLDMLVNDLETLRREGDVPVVIIDLRDGMKWKRLNLYLLARLLDDERYVQLVFTEMRGGRDGFLVGTCRPADLTRQFERALPDYAAAVGSAGQAGVAAPAALMRPTPARLEVARLSARLQPIDTQYVSAAHLAELLGPKLDVAVVEQPGDSLTAQEVSAIVRAHRRFTPRTSQGQVIDIVDRDAVALDVARAAVQP